MANTALEITNKAKKVFGEGDFETAIQLFSESAEAYQATENFLDAAEAKNNLSVALLQAGRAAESLEAVKGTETVFAEAGDQLREAMAIGNQAAALEGIGDFNKALELYEKSAALFGEINEQDYRATVLKSIAGLKLRKFKLQDTALTMLDSLNATQNPTFLQRVLKFFLRLIR